MQHGATEQWGGSRHHVPAHQEDFPRIHDVKDETKAEWLSTEDDGEIYRAPSVSGVGYRVIGRCKGGRTSGIGCVDVGGSVSEIARPVRSKTTHERHATVRGVKARYSKCIISCDLGRAVRGGVRLFDGSGRDPSSPSRGIEFNDLGVATRAHGERELR